MQKLTLIFAALVAAVVVAPAAAAQPQPLTITMNGHVTGPNSVSGTWTATGVVDDAGTYTETLRFVGETIHVQKVLVGSEGTIVLEARGVVEWISPCTVTFRAGSWRIVSGTGAYADLTGGGSPVTTAASFGDVCTGVVQIQHEGEGQNG